MRNKLFVRCAMLLVLATWLSACGTAAPTPAPVGTPLPTCPANTVCISIVTNGTKADWLNAVTKTFNAARIKTAAGHYVQVEVKREDTPEATVQRVVDRELQSVLWSPSDISWVDQANQLRKEKGQSAISSDPCPPVAYIPTGFAMWRPMAQALGWPDKPISWKQIIALSSDPNGWATYGNSIWGQFTFGHSHPQYSSTGFNLLASLAYAAAGKTAGLSPQDVKSPAVKEAFRKVEKNTYYYGNSTTALLNPMETRGASYLHAAMATETAVLYPDANKKTTNFDIVFVFPAEGTYWMDNPTCILDASWVTPEQREAAALYREHLLSPASQELAVDIGLRPAIPGIEIHCPICLDGGTDPRMSREAVPPLEPVSADTKAAILEVFYETKKKATVFVVLDQSGSMRGDKLTNAISATQNFMARLDPADKVQVNVFSYQVESLNALGARSAVQEGLFRELAQLKPSGKTLLNDAICTAMQAAQSARERDRAAGEARLYGIVLITDGIEGGSEQTDPLACLPRGEGTDTIKIFTIAYGKNADAKLLKQIADLTNAKAYTGDPATIEQVYQDIQTQQ